MLPYKDLYDAEAENRERVRAAVAVPIGLLTVFIGLLGTMLHTYQTDSSLCDVLFGWWFVTGSYFALRTIYYLIRVYHGHGYKAMPSVLELREHHDALVRWHRETGSNDAAADADFESVVSDQYARAADHNFYSNNNRSEFLFRATRELIYCGIFTALAYGPFIVVDLSRPAPVYHVIVVDSVHPSTLRESNVR